MKFEKTTQKCDIPFGLYRVDHRYLDNLHKADKNVISPEENDLYCGPVYHAKTERGVIGFFVPVDSATYESKRGFLIAFDNGILADVFDYKKTIPVVHERFVQTFTENTELIEFCDNLQEKIEECGEIVLNASITTII